MSWTLLKLAAMAAPVVIDALKQNKGIEKQIFYATKNYIKSDGPKQDYEKIKRFARHQSEDPNDSGWDKKKTTYSSAQQLSSGALTEVTTQIGDQVLHRNVVHCAGIGRVELKIVKKEGTKYLKISGISLKKSQISSVIRQDYEPRRLVISTLQGSNYSFGFDTESEAAIWHDHIRKL